MKGLFARLCHPRRRRAEAWASVYACTVGRETDEPDHPAAADSAGTGRRTRA